MLDQYYCMRKGQYLHMRKFSSKKSMKLNNPSHPSIIQIQTQVFQTAKHTIPYCLIHSTNTDQSVKCQILCIEDTEMCKTCSLPWRRSMLDLQIHKTPLRNLLKKPQINTNKPLRNSGSPLTLLIRAPKVSLKSIRMDQKL